MTKPILVLVNPPQPYLVRPGLMIQLGLMYIAAVLEDNGYDIVFEDLSGHSIQGACEHLMKYEGILCIAGTSLDIPTINTMADALHKRFHIVVGGAGATYSPEFYSNNVHTIVQGEAESIICDVIRDILLGVSTRLISGNPTKDIDSIPFPARHLLTNQGGGVFLDTSFTGPSTILTTSRGCPYRCAFCASGGGKLRNRSISNVMKEIEGLRHYGIAELRFADDTITTHRRRFEELCDALTGRGFTWRTSARVKPNDVELFQMMRDSGCIEVSFGIESGDQDVLDFLHKDAKVEDGRKALINAHKAGLKTRVLMMMNLPGTTIDTARRDIAFLESVPYSMVALKGFVPLPGSAIWERPDDYGVTIICKDLDKYNYFISTSQGEKVPVPLVRLESISPDDLLKGQIELLKYIKSVDKLHKG